MTPDDYWKEKAISPMDLLICACLVLAFVSLFFLAYS